MSAARRLAARMLWFLVCLGVLTGGLAAQTPPAGGAAPAPARAEPDKDLLGRSTPRGTVLGFLTAARKGDDALARQYLNTRTGDRAAEELAHQLFVVLDVRLPPTLTLINDTPGGSRANPLLPDQEVVGSVEGPDGPVGIVLQRVVRANATPIWLFSEATLAEVAPVYDDIAERRAGRVIPAFLFDSRIGSVRLFEWAAVLLAVTALYIGTVILNRLLTAVLMPLWRRLTRRPTLTEGDVLPIPARVLLITIVSRWTFARLPVSLLVRQQMANVAALATIVSAAWLLILLNGALERRILSRIARAPMSATFSLLRLVRRLCDVLVVVAAVIVLLRHYGVDPTPLLAGLGVGGLAVALAAQKTLENVIAGASLIFDQAVRVGDFLRVGTIEGTVEHIGLRSTRIRTLDRSLVSVPNSQIANMSLETLSARDKFWFHPTVGLRYETTNAQMRLVLDGVRQMLARQTEVDGASVRVRFQRLNAFSLDVDIFAYVLARDWAHFLEIQEGLLLKITEIVSAAGTGIAFPSQTMYVERDDRNSRQATQDLQQIKRSGV